MARGRNFPMSGQNWKDAQGTFQSDWTGAWLVGAVGIFVVVFLIILALAFHVLP